MDQVKIRAAVAAHGLAKDAEVTVAATPTVEGAISNGVFVELERTKAESTAQDANPEGRDDETPVPNVENVELPEVPQDKPKAPPRRRG